MKPVIRFMSMAESVSRYSAALLALMMVVSLCRIGDETGELYSYVTQAHSWKDSYVTQAHSWKDGMMKNKPCDEIYVVGEGETLHSISDKCGDPYIVEENPHVHDPDDVFPGLVIKITTPFTSIK